jgi:hypothetical protein
MDGVDDAESLPPRGTCRRSVAWLTDAAEDGNADWEAARRQFTLMRDTVAALDGALQVIVCDHANHR